MKVFALLLVLSPLCLSCGTTAVTNPYAQAVSIIDTSDSIARLFDESVNMDRAAAIMRGRYLLSDSTEPGLFASNFRDLVSLRRFGMIPSGPNVEKRVKDSLIRILIENERRLSSTPKSGIDIDHAYNMSPRAEAMLFFSPLSEGMMIAALLPTRTERGTQSLVNLQRFNGGVLIFFEESGDGYISKWVARKVAYD